MAHEDILIIKELKKHPELYNKIVEDPKRMNSRKFDIEFRTQYFYYYDQSSGNYEQVAVKVPMFFVQEEDFEDVIDLVEDKNKIDITFKTVGEDLNAVMVAYDSMIPAFIEVKELITEEVIVAYIGEKIIFVSEE